MIDLSLLRPIRLAIKDIDHKASGDAEPAGNVKADGEHLQCGPKPIASHIYEKRRNQQHGSNRSQHRGGAEKEKHRPRAKR